MFLQVIFNTFIRQTKRAAAHPLLELRCRANRSLLGDTPPNMKILEIQVLLMNLKTLVIYQFSLSFELQIVPLVTFTIHSSQNKRIFENILGIF